MKSRWSNLREISSTLGGLALLLLLTSHALGQSTVSPEQEKLARKHLAALCEHIDSLRYGSFSFELTRSPQGKDTTVAPGHIQFDFDRDLASCNLLDRRSCPTFWSRDGNAQYLVHNLDVRSSVSIFARDYRNDFYQSHLPFDIREVPFLDAGCLIVPRVLPYQSSAPYFMNRPVTSFREVGDMIEFTLGSPSDVRESIKMMPESLRQRFLDMLEKEKLPPENLPVLRGKSIYQFDRHEFGLLKHKEIFTTPFGKEDWKRQSQTNIQWTKFDNRWVPIEAKVSESAFGTDNPAEEIKLTISWHQVNQDRDQLDFRPDAVKELRGRNLWDHRFPDGKFVGVVGDGQNRPEPPAKEK